VANLLQELLRQFAAPPIASGAASLPTMTAKREARALFESVGCECTLAHIEVALGGPFPPL
jgi:hypothetical protein